MDDFDDITCEEYYQDEGYYDELERDYDEPYEPVTGCDADEYSDWDADKTDEAQEWHDYDADC